MKIVALLLTWELSVLKNTPLRENLNVQFRTGIFNIPDRTNFNSLTVVVITPSGISPTAGLITSTGDIVTADSVRR
jgi:hypothetical protein